MYKMLLCYDIRRPGAAMLVGPVIRHSLCALSISHFSSKITDFLCRHTMLVCWDPAAFPSKRRGDLILYGTIHRPPI